MSSLASIATSGILMPEEKLQAAGNKFQHLSIGIPKEISKHENRVPLCPDAVSLLVNNGHHVLLEAGAGTTSNFHDNEYSEAGAQIAYSPEEVYKNAEIILKVAAPTSEEIEMMQSKQILISALQITTLSPTFVKALAAKHITALSYEYIQDKSGSFPLVRAMSEIAGSAAILIAAEYLSNTHNGKGELLGGVSGITPSEVVILGAGTVGEYATRAALGLGSQVMVFDNSMYKLRRLQSNIGTRVITSIIVPSILKKYLSTADVVIGAILAKEGRTPCIVNEEMVSEMKPGSVIIDVSIDQGGCFETSEITNHTNPTFRKYGVIHYCVPNIASRVSRTASYALSNVFTPILLNTGEQGGVDNMLWDDVGVRRGVYLYKGYVTNRYLSDLAKSSYKDLDLLMATRRF